MGQAQKRLLSRAINESPLFYVVQLGRMKHSFLINLHFPEIVRFSVPRAMLQFKFEKNGPYIKNVFPIFVDIFFCKIYLSTQYTNQTSFLSALFIQPSPRIQHYYPNRFSHVHHL